jgi:hypothetical protein
VDYPFAAFWRELLDVYPNAKVGPQLATMMAEK